MRSRQEFPPVVEESPALGEHEFRCIRELARRTFGLDLRPGKEMLVAARLGKQIRQLRFRSFQEYYRHAVADPTGEALTGLIDALTTNHTGFLREPAHFDFLREVVLPSLAARDRISIWNAACSSGEEPYSLACAALAALGPLAQAKLGIMATDISTRVLDVARQAAYSAERFEYFPQDWRRRFLLRGEGRWAGWFRMKPAVRRLVEFRRMNLVEPFPPQWRYPVIFCRNVMIYFDRPTREQLVHRLAGCLEPGGYLFVGHAESLAGMDQPLAYVRPAVYRKRDHGKALPRGVVMR